MATTFRTEEVTSRDDDGPAVLTLTTTIDGFPVSIEVKYVDDLSVLKFFKRLGTDQALFSLAETLDEAYGEED